MIIAVIIFLFFFFLLYLVYRYISICVQASYNAISCFLCSFVFCVFLECNLKKKTKKNSIFQNSPIRNSFLFVIVKEKNYQLKITMKLYFYLAIFVTAIQLVFGQAYIGGAYDFGQNRYGERRGSSPKFSIDNQLNKTIEMVLIHQLNIENFILH